MNRYLAELVGTFVLVFASCGSAVLAGDKIGFLGVSLAFGLSLLAMVYAIGPVSGCHINPAVTVGILISKKILMDVLTDLAARCRRAVAVPWGELRPLEGVRLRTRTCPDQCALLLTPGRRLPAGRNVPKARSKSGEVTPKRSPGVR